MRSKCIVPWLAGSTSGRRKSETRAHTRTCTHAHTKHKMIIYVHEKRRLTGPSHTMAAVNQTTSSKLRDAVTVPTKVIRILIFFFPIQNYISGQTTRQVRWLYYFTLKDYKRHYCIWTMIKVFSTECFLYILKVLTYIDAIYSHPIMLKNIFSIFPNKVL